MATNTMHMEFGIKIFKKTYAPETMPPTESRYRKMQYGRQASILKVTLLKTNRLLPIHTSDVPVNLDLIFEAKLKLESGKRKFQDGCQAAILKVTSLKIHRLLPIATNNMHVKF